MNQCQNVPAVTIETGPVDWQIIQQGTDGTASVTLEGKWWTVQKRSQPEVRVSVIREGTFTPVTRKLDRVLAVTMVDSIIHGEDAGKTGTWQVTLDRIPAGGPYQLQTSVGSAEDAIEWRRGGEIRHFLGVGDVWLIAGQSNAEGYGRNPVEDQSEIGVHECVAHDGWRLAAHGSLHHPWLSFAKILKRDLGYPVGLIPTAVGGTPVSRWDPGQDGDLFQNMCDRVKSAGGGIKGCLWYQGESDTGEDDYPFYNERFTRFAEGLRGFADQPELPIITVQLNRLLSAENGRGWEAIREIQRQLSHELDHVFLLSAFDAVLCDGIHNGCQGNLLIGQRAADIALGGVYGRDIDFRHPECARAVRVDDTTVDLQFDHVVIRLDYAASWSTGFPFSVRDECGEVPIKSYALPAPDVIRIELGRPLADAATVTGAPGSCPPHVVPKDIGGYRCMLGFTMPVEEGQSERGG